MEKLREEKQVELVEDFQAHQELMCENLQQHMESASIDEDKRIAEAVRQKIAKRDVSELLPARSELSGYILLRLNFMKNKWTM